MSLKLELFVSEPPIQYMGYISETRGTGRIFANCTEFLQVAAVSGDARRCLDICRRAVEIAESSLRI